MGGKIAHDGALRLTAGFQETQDRRSAQALRQIRESTVVKDPRRKSELPCRFLIVRWRQSRPTHSADVKTIFSTRVKASFCLIKR
jgi:hypothetical protein